MKRLVIIAAVIFPVLVSAQDGRGFYMPKFDAAVKAKVELSTEDGNYRFNVRNARLGLAGNVTDNISYRMQVDLSNQGTIQFLDAYASYQTGRFKINLGQQLYHFSSDMGRGPSVLIFANRSLLAKFITTFSGAYSEGGTTHHYVRQFSSRDLGALATYSITRNSSVKATVGFFSGSGVNNPQWDNSLNVITRLDVKPVTGLRVSASFYDGNTPEQGGYRDRLRMVGAEAEYSYGNLHIGGEYARRYMKNEEEKYRLLTAAYLQGVYYFKMNSPQVKYLAPALRWDMANGLVFRENLSGGLDKTDVNRVTAGINIGFSEAPVKAEIRLNYEKYLFGDKPADLSVNKLFQDKITLEFVAAF